MKPPPIPPHTKGMRIKKINAFTYGKLIALMLRGEYSGFQLATKTGLHVNTVYEFCRELRNARAAHICEWRQDVRGRESIKIFKIGQGVDAKAHKYTQAEKAARSRANKKARLLQAALTATPALLSTLEHRSDEDHEDGATSPAPTGRKRTPA